MRRKCLIACNQRRGLSGRWRWRIRARSGWFRNRLAVRLTLFVMLHVGVRRNRGRNRHTWPIVGGNLGPWHCLARLPFQTRLG